MSRVYHHGEHVVDQGPCIRCDEPTLFRLDGECPPCSFEGFR